METLRINTPKARKEHICDWCQLKIVKDDEYRNTSHVDEGSVYTWKAHIHCCEVLDKIGAWDDGDGISTDAFQECLKNEYADIMSNHFTEEYESKDFKYPNFEGQLNFVLKFHNITK